MSLVTAPTQRIDHRNSVDGVQPNLDHQEACNMRQSPNQLSRPPDKKKRVAAAEPTVPRTIAKRGVLVVDDDHMVRIMLQLGLERNGFDVWLAQWPGSDRPPPPPHGRDRRGAARCRHARSGRISGTGRLARGQSRSPGLFHEPRHRPLRAGRAASARCRICLRQAVPSGRPGENPPANGAGSARRFSRVRQVS